MSDLRALIGRASHHLSVVFLSNPWRNRRIRRQQDEALRAIDVSCRRAVIFVVPGFDRVDGGILSLSSLAEESKKLAKTHGANIFICPYPKEPPVASYTMFDNSMTLLNYSSLISKLDDCIEILFHVPECYIPSIGDLLEFDKLRDSGISIKINILIQNIDSAPTIDQIDVLREFGNVTATTAHKSYTTEEMEKRLGIKLHHLSVWNSPEAYQKLKYEEKDNLILLSPDDARDRGRVIKALRRALPAYEFKVVRNMSYREYRELCNHAKFTLTFGEGLDGYYVETIFSGGVSCAVYNDRFFTEKYKNLPLMFDEWEEVIRQLPDCIKRLDSAEAYAAAWWLQFEVASSDYRYDEYQEKIASFYTDVVGWNHPPV
jgi:hypothetical protein